MSMRPGRVAAISLASAILLATAFYVHHLIRSGAERQHAEEAQLALVTKKLLESDLEDARLGLGLVGRGLVAGRPRAAEWFERVGSDVVAHEHLVSSLVWAPMLDGSGSPAFRVRFTTDPTIAGTDVRWNLGGAAFRDAYEVARVTGVASLTAPMSLPGGRLGSLIVSPIEGRTGPAGVVIGVVRSSDVEKRVRSIAAGASLVVADEDRQIAATGGDAEAGRLHATVTAGGRRWTVSAVVHGTAGAGEVASAAAAGILLALLVAGTSWASTHGGRRARSLVDERVGEERALRRLAMAVATNGDAAAILTQAARDAAEIVSADAGVVLRVVGNDLQTMGSWGAEGIPPRRIGSTMPLAGESAAARAVRTAAPARIDDLSDGNRPDPIRALFRSGAAVPIRVGGEVWGALAVASRGSALAVGAEGRLVRLARLLELAVVSAEAREALIARASTDPLTGLANHREFKNRLGEAVGAALRSRKQVALAIIDVDCFKGVNDSFGHRAGDGVLTAIGRLVSEAALDGETAARLGGDEFALIMPGVDGVSAWERVDALRADVAARPLAEAGYVSVSIGVADLVRADSAEELHQQADTALYWAKRHGRGACFAHAPEMASVMSRASVGADGAGGRPDGVRALARAVDARAPRMARHSERVAEIASAIAMRLGWASERQELLREACLVHDVGKIAIPDDVLLKPGRLTEAEFAMVKSHCDVGATIVSDVLTSEQVEWVRGHHERWDGGGYPQGLRGEAIPEGARIIAVADAFDSMTIDSGYRAPRSGTDALAECRACAGAQFWSTAVDGLVAAFAEGVMDIVVGAVAPPEGTPSDLPAAEITPSQAQSVVGGEEARP